MVEEIKAVEEGLNEQDTQFNHQKTKSATSASAEKNHLSGGDSASADFANELFSDIERVKHSQ